MTTIYIKYGTPQETQAALEAALAEQAKHNPAWSGADFKVNFDEFVWIDTDEEIVGTELMHNTVYPVLA